jgi:N-acetylmuramoyl-L-alanine amidase
VKGDRASNWPRTLHVLQALVLFAATLAVLSGRPTVARTAETLAISSDLQIVIHAGRQIELLVRPASAGEVSAAMLRVTGDPTGIAVLRRLNKRRPLKEAGWMRVPLAMLSSDYRALVLKTLFPKDVRDGDDWVHRARHGELAMYDEGLWQVAEWFTGNGGNFKRLMKVNRLTSPELQLGQRIRIPAALLHPALSVRIRSDDGLLEFDSDSQGPHAVYRLKAGEALYSSVIIRFTGRTGDEDVGELVETLRKRSGIRDLRDIPAGYPIKIPVKLLEPDFLPRSHPRRIQAEAAREELAQELLRQPVADHRTGLEGVLIVLDSGHGGKDLGTMNNGIWEHDYVYDVACRLKKKLERQTEASVRMILEDKDTGYEPSATDKLEANRQGTILTTPPFLARAVGDAKIGVNLRWYLANSIYRQALRDGFDSDRVVFLSLHADSRHPSLRGVMVYVPGADYRTKTYGYFTKSYSKYKEVRDKPTVRFSRKQRVRSEAVSRELAAKIVDGFEDLKLPVQSIQPVRHRIIRGSQRYAPAVIRGNQVPTKVLVEMVNLSNPEDAAVLASARDRERLSEAVLEALLNHFGDGRPPAHP